MRGRGRRHSSSRQSGEGKSRRRGDDGKSASMWAIGDKVEVRSDEEGFIGAWYEAEVVYIESSVACIVEYEQLVGDDGFPLQEPALLSNLRPRPPPLPAISSWLHGHLVEAYDRDGWWAGVVVRILSYTGDVLVRFRTTGEELPFNPSLLRGLQNWDNGEWQNLTQVGRSDEDHDIDINRTSGPAHCAKPLRKKGRPRKSKLPRVDLLSTLSKEMSLVIGQNKFGDVQAFTDPHVDSTRTPNVLSSCNAPRIEASWTMSNAGDAFISASGNFAHHSDVSQGQVRLELLAYELLVKALHSKGPLNWKQEQLLADVRLHLNITSTEQTLVLERMIGVDAMVPLSL